MSREQASGDPWEIDVRTDVYSTGAILYELVTGATPHDLKGLSIVAAVQRICEVDYRPPRELNARLPFDVVCILNAALARHKEDRYASAGAFAADIRRHLAGEPVDVRNASAFYRLARFAARNRLIAAVASIAVLMAPVLVWGVFSFRLQAHSLEQAQFNLRHPDGPVQTALEALFQSAAQRYPNDRPGALEEYRICREAVLKIFEPDDDIAIAATHNYALMLLENGQAPAAEPLLRDVIERRARLLEPTHQKTVGARLDLGRVLLEVDQLDAAEKLFADGERQIAVFGADSIRASLLVRYNRAKIAQKQDRFQDAEALLLSGLADSETTDAFQKLRGRIELELLAVYQTWQEHDPKLAIELQRKRESMQRRIDARTTASTDGR
jgi:hypothetical protein